MLTLIADARDSEQFRQSSALTRTICGTEACVHAYESQTFNLWSIGLVSDRIETSN